VIRIRVPPLRERAEDIPLLVNSFVKKFAAEQGKPIKKVSSLAMRVLCSYSFPGNVRELENTIERCVTFEQSDILTATHLPEKMVQQSEPMAASDAMDIPPEGIDINRATEELERKLIVRALEIAGGNRSRAAKLLGITLRSLRYRLVKLGMDADEKPQA
jgi:two-component system response regulator PilR (NtrC family)